MISAEDVIEEFKRIARELERDGETPTWAVEDIETVIRNLIRRGDHEAEGRPG